MPISSLSKGEKTRLDIIRKANRLFYHQGYNHTSFNDIARAAGLQKGNFYYHFKTKDEVLNAVINFRLQTIETMLADWRNAYPQPQQALMRFVQMLQNDRDVLARYGCPMGSLNMELGKTQPELKQKARKMFDLFVNFIEEQLTKLSINDSHNQALSILGRAQGIAMMAHVYDDSRIIDRETQKLLAQINSLESTAI